MCNFTKKNSVADVFQLIFFSQIFSEELFYTALSGDCFQKKNLFVTNKWNGYNSDSKINNCINTEVAHDFWGKH